MTAATGVAGVFKTVRFVKRYSVGRNAFMAFERDGDRHDVKVADDGVMLLTRREARIVAADHWAGKPAAWQTVCDDYTSARQTLSAALAQARATRALGSCQCPHVVRSGDLVIVV